MYYDKEFFDWYRDRYVSPPPPDAWTQLKIIEPQIAKPSPRKPILERNAINPALKRHIRYSKEKNSCLRKELKQLEMDNMRLANLIKQERFTFTILEKRKRALLVPAK